MAIRTLTYYPSANLQTFVVPINTTRIHVDCVASKGTDAIWNNINRGDGGYGGRVQCDLTVTSGQKLYIMVGNIPTDGKYASYNASDIRINGTALQNRIIVAGGGGSSGYGGDTGFKKGGGGGGITGEAGADTGGTGNKKSFGGSGGTQTEGGISRNNKTDTKGQLGLGGNSIINRFRLCGAGGAGYYGGGGADGTGYHSGDTESWGAGGGGGSSYTNSTYCTNVIHTQGYNNGSGYVVLIYESSENLRYNQLYKGSRQVDYVHMTLPGATIGKTVKKVYKGSELVYLFGFENKIFYPSNSLQTFTVPLGIDKVKVDCVASKGMDGGSAGGKGARVQCILKVTSGQKLYIAVGKMPTSRNIPVYNASDIRTSNSGGMLGTASLNSRLVVAGGGGSGAGATNKPGGDGGYSSGSNSSGFYSTEAIGGSQSAGGTGAQFNAWSSAGYNYVNGGDGTFGLGGTATSSYGIAGAGGAGWYGGGGGIGATLKKVGSSTSGGAGGSSYTNSIYCTNVQHERGYNNGSGYILISMVD